MWNSRTKTDLIIEVWEKLDCESIGRAEIEAVETAVGDRFGAGAVDSPMSIARLLADEGAALRHAEIMTLALERDLESPYAPLFRNLLRTSTLDETYATIRRFEGLRQRFLEEKDREGQRLVREQAVKARRALADAAVKTNSAVAGESADWFRIWLESPEIFENWVALRRASADFKAKFGEQ